MREYEKLFWGGGAAGFPLSLNFKIREKKRLRLSEINQQARLEFGRLKCPKIPSPNSPKTLSPSLSLWVRRSLRSIKPQIHRHHHLPYKSPPKKPSFVTWHACDLLRRLRISLAIYHSYGLLLRLLPNSPWPPSPSRCPFRSRLHVFRRQSAFLFDFCCSNFLPFCFFFLAVVCRVAFDFSNFIRKERVSSGNRSINSMIISGVWSLLVLMKFIVTEKC